MWQVNPCSISTGKYGTLGHVMQQELQLPSTSSSHANAKDEKIEHQV